MPTEPLTTRIENHLRRLPPIAMKQKTAALLREALAEILRLHGVIYDRLVHGEIDGYESDEDESQ